MEHTSWDHSFPCSIIQPPDKTSPINITVGLLLHTSRDIEQHIYYDHQTVDCKYIWKCHHCVKHFDSDDKIREHLNFLKNAAIAEISETTTLFPIVKTVLPDKMLLKLAKRDNPYNSLLNADSEELFHLGLEASVLKKRLYLEREPRIWERDYVKFLKDTDDVDISNTEDFPHSLQKLNTHPMDIQPALSTSWSENAPIAITTDDIMKRISQDQWQAMANQLHLNNKMIEGVTDTIHFQCGLLQSIPSEQLTESEHHHLEKLLKSRDLPPEFKQLHKASTKEVGSRLDDLTLGSKRKY